MVDKKFYKKMGQKLVESTIKGNIKTLKKLNPLLSISPADLILDFGCGVGHLTIPLQQYSNNVVGIDILATF